MAIKGEKRGEMYFRWFVHIAGGIGFPLLFILYGFVFKQTCDMDKIYLWCRVHPFTTLDLIGTILFFAGCVGLSGIWFLFTGDLDENPGRGIMIGSFVTALLGAMLAWA